MERGTVGRRSQAQDDVAGWRSAAPMRIAIALLPRGMIRSVAAWVSASMAILSKRILDPQRVDRRRESGPTTIPIAWNRAPAIAHCTVAST
jgi:hypothetical protein